MYCCDIGEYDLVPGWQCTGYRTDDGRNALIWEPDDGKARPMSGTRSYTTGPVATPDRLSRKTLTAREEREGREPRSDFERMTEDLEITVLRDPHSLFVAELGLRLDAAKVMDWRPWRDRDGRRCWAVPEWVLHEGQIRRAGWNLRYPAGTGPIGRDKLTLGNHDLPSGFRRGLFRPTDWSKGPEGSPLLLPEGASGTTTLAMLGVRCLGRHNNGWGDTQTIAHMVRQAGLIEAGTPIVVLADYDPDVDRYDPTDPLLFHFPGRWGARRAAASLARELGVPVRVAFVPFCKGKDARDWYAENRTAGTVDQLRDRFLAGLRWDMTVQPDNYDTVWSLPCYREPVQSIRPASPVPCAGGDGASESATPPAQVKESDYSDLERLDFSAPEEIPTLAEAGQANRSRQTNTGEHPCDNPSCVLLRSRHNWDLLELDKRCGKCPGCLLAKIATARFVVLAILGAFTRAGGNIYERRLPAEQFEAFRRAFNRSVAKDPGPGPFGHFYFQFYQPAGRIYILTSLPTEGTPVSLGEAICEVADCLEHAVHTLNKVKLFTSSQNVAKKRLPARDPEYDFEGAVEPCSDEYRAQVAEEAGASIHEIEVAPNDPATLRKQIYRKAGGWDIESNERVMNALLGYGMGELNITLTGNDQADDSEPALCGVADDGWECLPEDHPF